MHPVSKVGVALLVLAAVCLVNPLYLPALVGHDGPGRVSTSYHADVVNASAPDDPGALANRYGRDVVLDIDTVGASDADYDYRAPNATRDFFGRTADAAANASATNETTNATTNAAVAADARALGRNYSYLEADEGGPYYAMGVTGNASAATLRLASRNATAVGRAVVRNETVAWSALNASERGTVAKVVDANVSYRPTRNESLPDTPLLVRRDGTVYGVSAYATGKYVGGAFVLGYFLWGAAVVLVALAAVLGGVGHLLNRRGRDGDD